MKSKQKLLLFIFCLILFFVSAWHLNGFYICNYTDKNGLSMNIALSVVQDKNGYIWIATQDGLNRFDGVDVKVFTKEHGLPNNFINDLYVDSKGYLWVATRGGAARFNYKEKKFYGCTKEEHGLTHNIVRCIGESKKHGILIGTESGLNVIKDGKLLNYSNKHPLLGCKIQSIAVNDETGIIYIGSLGDGLIIYREGQKPKQIKKEENKNRTPNDLSIKNIKTLLLDKAGLWIGTDEGLTLFKDGKFIKVYTTINSDLSNNAINELFKDSAGNFWIATTDGLNLLKDDNFITYDISNGLTGNNVLSFCEDHEKGLWIGTYGGISYFGKGKFKIYSMKEGMPTNIAFGIYPAKDGRIWVACYGGIAVIDDRDENNVKIISYTTKEGLPSNTIRTITEDKDGIIWIGTLGGGLTRYKNGQFKSYTQKDGLPNNNVRVVYGDKNDELWLGMEDGGLVLFDKIKGQVKAIYNTKTEKQLLNDNVRFINEDNKENLWIGVDGGICKFNLKEKKFTNYSAAEGLICKDTHGILEDGEGYWITTFGDGLYYFNENLPTGKQFKQFTTETTENGLPDNCVYSVVKDNQGRMWMPTNKGVCCWDRKDGKFINYTVNHGFPSNENNAHGGVKDQQGRIWFSTCKGVAWIDPVNIFVNEIVPPVYIEELMVNNERVDTFTLNYDQNNIFIKFTALSFQFPDAVKFKIRLEGYHRPHEWVEPLGNNRFVEYTNLPAGSYKFLVKAANNDGVWNEKGSSISFNIKPSFFQTIWFYVSLVVFIFLLFYGFFLYRTTLQRRQQKQLEQMVKERTRELEKRTRELQSTHVQLIHQGKMASLGELAAELAHEMNNPANYIYGNIDFLQKFINDIKSILAEYMKLELPEGHKINTMRKTLDIDNKLEELEGLIKYVKEGAIRIAEIVMNLRYFVGKGKDESAPEPTNIHKNIETTLNLLHNKTKEKTEIKIKFNKIPSIECYPSQLNQVFMNVLSNAADAIKEKGTITIETLNEEDRNVIIKISDTGEGIAPGNLSRIYEPFFTTKDREEGMGLGLTITRKIIERHRGTIDVKSEKGKGTTFTITLPIKYSDLKSEGDSKKWESMAKSTKS